MWGLGSVKILQIHEWFGSDLNFWSQNFWGKKKTSQIWINQVQSGICTVRKYMWRQILIWLLLMVHLFPLLSDLCFSSATPTTCMSSLTKTIKLLFGLSLFLFFLGACFSPSLSWYNHHLSKIHLQTCAVPLMWNFLILGSGVAVTEDGNATSWSWSFESQLQSQLQNHYSHNLHHSQKEDGLIRYFGDESEAPDEQ